MHGSHLAHTWIPHLALTWILQVLPRVCTLPAHCLPDVGPCGGQDLLRQHVLCASGVHAVSQAGSQTSQDPNQFSRWSRVRIPWKAQLDPTCPARPGIGPDPTCPSRPLAPPAQGLARIPLALPAHLPRPPRDWRNAALTAKWGKLNRQAARRYERRHALALRRSGFTTLTHTINRGVNSASAYFTSASRAAVLWTQPAADAMRDAIESRVASSDAADKAAADPVVTLATNPLLFTTSRALLLALALPLQAAIALSPQRPQRPADALSNLASPKSRRFD